MNDVVVGTPGSRPDLDQPVPERRDSPPGLPAGPAPRAVRIGVYLLPVALMLGLGLWGLNRGMWWDEISTYESATRTLPQLWHELHHVDAVHGLYYLLMHVILPVGGGNAVALRLPSVIGMAAAVAGTVAIGNRLGGRGLGLTAGAVLAVSPLASHYAQEGRSYALVTAAVVTATLQFLRAVERPTVGRWTGYAALVVLATVLHLFAVLVLLAHAVTAATGRIGRAALRGWLASAVGIGLLGLPWLLLMRSQSGQVSWLTKPDRKTVVDLLHQFGGPSTSVIALLALLVLVGALTPPRSGTADGSGTPVSGTPSPGLPGTISTRALALPWLVLPAGALLAYSFVTPAFNPRYVLHSLPALALMVGAGIDGLLRGLLRLLSGDPAGRRESGAGGASRPAFGWRALLTARQALALTALGVVFAAGLFAVDFHTQKTLRTAASRADDQTAVAELIGREGRPGDAVVFTPATKRGVEYVYAHDFTGINDVLQKESPAASGSLGGVEVAAKYIPARLRAQHRIWVIRRYRPQDDSRRGKAKQATLAEDFQLAGEWKYPGVAVDLYVHDA